MPENSNGGGAQEQGQVARFAGWTAKGDCSQPTLVVCGGEVVELQKGWLQARLRSPPGVQRPRYN